MTHKSQQAYEDIFDYINKSIFPLSTAKSFTSDYEVAMRNALRKLYPHAAMVACLFHFTQAVKRHASQTPGLMDLIKSKPDAASVYYRLQCLPLLHHQFIIDEFKKLRREAFGISQEAKDIFRSFFRYFASQWIEKVWNLFKFISESKQIQIAGKTGKYLGFRCNHAHNIHA